MTYDNNENQNERYTHNKRISLEDNNPWLQDKTPSDLSRESELLSNHYVEHHLKGQPTGQYSRHIENDLEAFYSVRDPTLKRYTIRRIAGDKRTLATTTNLSKNEYFISYNRDTQ